ncbi:hypothetical protein [Rummeliibacillus pycnus]|uniref:hypothetical protein n=1 Tax=Rummeliibacillus pycnus TaxID=101070 RepID=UPI003D28811B
MGYILPINDFQAAQYIKRSLQNKDHYSYIHSVQNTKKESCFSRGLERRIKRSDLKYWQQNSQFSYSVMKSLHTSSYEKNSENVTGKGLFCDFYV